jgi:ferritin-like metal-binding protein YciE
MNDLHELFLAELADVYGAEKQLLKALPKMAKAANSAELQEAFSNHLSETEEQVERIEQVFEAFDKPAKSKHCKAMEGLLSEGKEILDEWKGSAALDAALISAAQKVEHYEIASYGCLCTWAKLLDNAEALALLKQTMDEEETADQTLTRIAESSSNTEAEEGQGENGQKARNNRDRSAKPPRLASTRKT